MHQYRRDRTPVRVPRRFLRSDGTDESSKVVSYDDVIRPTDRNLRGGKRYIGAHRHDTHLPPVPVPKESVKRQGEELDVRGGRPVRGSGPGIDGHEVFVHSEVVRQLPENPHDLPDRDPGLVDRNQEDFAELRPLSRRARQLPWGLGTPTCGRNTFIITSLSVTDPNNTSGSRSCRPSKERLESGSKPIGFAPARTMAAMPAAS